MTMLVQSARKIVVFVVGMSVVLVGIVMIVAPGPAIVVIPAGLAILATEFVWAQILLKRMKEKARQVIDKTGWNAGK
jgi:tellurite resistance protein TerC